MQSAGLNALGLNLLTVAMREGWRTIKLGEVSPLLGIPPDKEKRLLATLASQGFLARVRRGLYLIPAEMPLGGRWNPSEALALNTLMEDAGARYQLSGPSAFSRYGWDDQVPNRVYVYNTRISGERTIGANRFTLILVEEARLGDTEQVKTAENISVVFASRARALLDAVYDWTRFNTLPRAYSWIRAELARDEAMASKLVETTMKFGNQGTARRMGFLLDSLDAPPALLRRLEKTLRPTTSFIPWNPASPKRGKVNNRWMVIANDTPDQ